MNIESSKELFLITDSGVREPSRISTQYLGYLFCCNISGEVEINGRRLDKGEVFVLYSSELVAACGNGRAAYFTVCGKLCQELCEIYGIGSGFSVNLGDKTEKIFRLVFGTEQGGELPYTEAVYVFHQLLKELREACLDGEKRKTDTVVLIKEYIDSRASGKLTLDDLSEIFFISRTQIFRLFKSRYGVPPMQYYLQKKIEIAKKMLLQGDKRVSDIAEELCFSDAKHFSKTFKKITGLLPKEFRRVT